MTMPEADRFDNGPKHARAAEAAARILNNHFDPSRPKGELYFEILLVIKTAMSEAEEDRAESRFLPGKN
jgi:hypothetical protein